MDRAAAINAKLEKRRMNEGYGWTGVEGLDGRHRAARLTPVASGDLRTRGDAHEHSRLFDSPARAFTSENDWRSALDAAAVKK